MNIKQLTSLTAAFLALAAGASADLIETKDGSRLIGTVLKIEDGTVTLKTNYAGDLVIKPDNIASIQIDEPRAIRLADKTVMEGRLQSTGPANVSVTSAAHRIEAPLASVARSWDIGGVDPDIAALARKWRYEAALDVTGKSGNSRQLGTAGSLRAKLAGPKDALHFYAIYDRQKSDGLITSDQLRGGIDYQNNFSDRGFWYVRDELGYDRVKDIGFYNTAAAGFGLEIIKQPKHNLSFRLGVASRFESYRTAGLENFNEIGIDAGLHHDWTFTASKIVTDITWNPAFKDFGEYRLFHESYYELPLSKSLWKFRVGISNDYNSTPPAGIKEMDTTYFIRLVLIWE